MGRYRDEVDRDAVHAMTLSVGCGGLSKIWPRWSPQRLQCTSVLVMEKTVVGLGLVRLVERRPEARPPDSAIELGGRGEQRLTAPRRRSSTARASPTDPAP